MLFQTDESTIPVEINDGIVVINNCHQADFDCDGDVDILDITMAAYTYGSSSGGPNYNPDYDIDDDGDVDVLDLTAIAFEYGWMANTP